jgi:hypothetical protein
MNLLLYTVCAKTSPREPAKCLQQVEYACPALLGKKVVHHPIQNAHHGCHCINQSPGRTDPKRLFDPIAIPKRVQTNHTSPIQLP